MSLQDELTLQRYRYVQERANYFADLARHTFSGYLVFFVVLSVVAWLTMAGKEWLGMREVVWVPILLAVGSAHSFVALASAAQIYFCIGRWKNFRNAECAINPDTPRMHPFGMAFNFVLIVLILGSLLLTWAFVLHMILNYPTTPGA